MDLIAFGELLWDVFDDKRLIGGAPFNVATHAARLGIETALVSAVGADALGIEALDQVTRLGLNTQYIRVVKEIPTGTARVYLTEGQPDYEIIRPAAYDAPELSDADIGNLAAAEPQWIYFSTLQPMSKTALSLLEHVLAALPRARRFYDVNLRKESYTRALLEKLLGHANVLKLNDTEAKTVGAMFEMGSHNIEDRCGALANRFELECVCVTRGEQGCALWREGEYVEARGREIAVADAVGAGDAFSAGLIHGLTRAWSFKKIVVFANNLGALVASREGAVAPWSLEEVVNSNSP